MSKLFVVLFFLFCNQTLASECSWCVSGDKKIAAELKEIAGKTPAERLKLVREKGLCIKVLNSGRKMPKGFFTWGEVESPSGDLTEVTQLKNLMGKTLCKGELAFSKACPTVALAADAPASTLLHEFLHFRQFEKDLAWCPLSKKLWSKPADASETKLIRDKEWDVHKALWDARAQLNFDVEDRVAILSETLEEAEARKSFDPQAAQYIKANNLLTELNEAVVAYKQKLGLK